MDRALQSLFGRVIANECDPGVMPGAMLVFAHPDDETIALGARLGRFAHAAIVHATDGAPRNGEDSRAHGFPTLDAYRRARQDETRCVLTDAGIPVEQLVCLGIPDQEAALCLPQLTGQIARLIAERRPEVIFTHPYEGGHPDHDACAFAVHAAIGQLEGTLPLIVEAPFYHLGSQGMTTGEFLSGANVHSELTLPLTSMEQEAKRRRLACFRTQQHTLQAFQIREEHFRIAPRYDFRLPPHPAPVFYDQYPWGMTSQRFCELALEAMHVLKSEATFACR